VLENLWIDFRLAARQLRANPWFTFISTAILALGIGANAAVFSMINTLLLRPLPLEEPSRLIHIWESSSEFDRMSVSYPNFLDWRDQNRVFEHLTAHRLETFNLTGFDRPERLLSTQVSASLFPMLRVEPMLGRPFLQEEDQPGADRVAILSHRLWQRRFGSSADTVGQSVHLDGDSYTVIGIMPKGFLYPLDEPDTEIYLPIGLFSDQWRERHNHPGISVVARLKPDLSLDRARADMITIAGRLEQQYPESNAGHSVSLWSFQELRVQGLRPALMVLLAAVGLVLLIACANVANLLLARAVARSHEIAIRVALGARRSRIVRQLLTESVLRSLLGGCLGLVIAMWGVHLISLSIPRGAPPIFQRIEIDGLVLTFALLLSILTGLAFGLVPSLQVSRPDLTESLKEGARSTSGGPRRQRFQNSLVTAEVALALLLLIAAALLMRSFLNIIGESPGFNPRNVVTMQISLSEAEYPEDEQARVFFNQLDERLQALPGVRHVGRSNPLFGGWQDIFIIEGRSTPSAGHENWTEVAVVNPGYFRSMEIALTQGRHFTAQDGQEAPRVAIVDRRFAEVHFPGEDPIGKRIKRGPGPGSEFPWLEIVGVVEPIRRYGQFFDLNTRVQLYQPHSQYPSRFMNLLVKTDLEPELMAAAIQEEILRLDPDQPIFNVRSMESLLADRLQPRRVSFILLTVFAGVALSLAALGVYGLMVYSVSQRTHEIGVRVALGAERKDVLRVTLARGMRLSFLGIGVGVLLAFLLTPSMEGLLYGVGARDPVLFVGLSLFMAIVSLAASIHPAYRATRVTPVEALRYE
jgi:putative ABC transport system permease protein